MTAGVARQGPTAFGDALARLAGDADRDLVARVLPFVLAPWADPQRLQRVLAARLDAGAPVTARGVVADLEALAVGERRALPAAEDVRTAALALADRGARLLVVDEPGYPRRLAAAWPELGAPLWLLHQGPVVMPDVPAVAVVGTRRPTREGLASAQALGRLLAGAGVLVISGMARGIDQAAHRGALAAGGVTAAVLGAGLDVDYPKGDDQLRCAIAASAGLCTELPLGARPHAPHFLARNRIVAGLADATIVVEGRERSGSLQTARLAAAQGREVAALVGSVHLPQAQAPLDLIRDGARPLTRIADALELVGLDPSRAEAASGPARPPLDSTARAVLDLLGSVPASPGDLATASGRPIADVLAAIGELTARGLAISTPTGVVHRPRR